MPDEPTPWELHRSMEALRRSLESGFANLNARLDRVVPTDLFHAHQQAIQRQFDDHERELSELKAAREADKKDRETEKNERATVRRLVGLALFTAFIAPLGLMLLQLWLLSKGGT